MTAAEERQLDEQGFVVLEGLLPGAFLETLRSRTEDLFQKEGENAGSEFRQEPHARRLANLVDKGEVFQQVVAYPEVLERVAWVLRPPGRSRKPWRCAKRPASGVRAQAAPKVIRNAPT